VSVKIGDFWNIWGQLTLKSSAGFGHPNLVRTIYNISYACTLREISKRVEFTWVRTMEQRYINGSQ